MPHILKDLGWFTFLTNVAGASVIVTFSAILYQESCAHVMMKHKDSLENDDAISREPYKTVARLAVEKTGQLQRPIQEPRILRIES